MEMRHSTIIDRKTANTAHVKTIFIGKDEIMCIVHIVEVENVPEIKSRNEPLTVTSVLAECF